MLTWINNRSLDAPTVVVAWAVVVGEVGGKRPDTVALFLLFTGVWMMYAQDRWFDAREGERSIRHDFAARNRRVLQMTWWAVLLHSLLLSVVALPLPNLLFGLGLAGAAIVYSAVVHTPAVSRTFAAAGGKELSTALLLTAAVVGFAQPVPTFADGLALAVAGLFLGNCAAVSRATANRCHLRHRLLPLLAAFLGIAGSATLFGAGHSRAFLAVLLAAALLTALARHPERLAGAPALADLCLIAGALVALI